MKLKNYIIFLIVLCILFTIGIHLYQALKPMRVLVSPVGFASHDMEAISTYISKYYENNNNSVEKILTSDVVNFLENECGNIFPVKPGTGYNPKYDYGVFLLLPEELKSDAPTIIAYTTPLQREKYIKRVALFLNGSKMTAIQIDNYSFEKMLDLDESKESPTPDFYHCKNAKK